MNQSEAIDRVLAIVPSFRERWEKYLDEWDQNPPGACSDFAQLAEFVHDAITQGPPLDLPAIFKFIERCLMEGEEAVQTAATTCFLENLQNKETPADAWVHLLGPKSAAYCRDWDAFTGVDTPGLKHL